MATPWRTNYLRYRKFFLNIYRVYNQKPDVKMFIESLLTLGVIAFFGVTALRPTLLTIIELREQIKAKEEVVSKMDTKIQNLSIAQSLYSQELDTILLVDQAIPDSVSIDTAVRQFEGLAKTSSTSVLGMSSGDVMLKGVKEKEKRKKEEFDSLPQGAGELPFTISVSGSFNSLNTFLKNLKSTRRPFKTDIAVVNSSSTDTGTILVLILTGRLPFLK